MLSNIYARCLHKALASSVFRARPRRYILFCSAIVGFRPDAPDNGSVPLARSLLAGPHTTGPIFGYPIVRVRSQTGSGRLRRTGTVFGRCSAWLPFDVVEYRFSFVVLTAVLVNADYGKDFVGTYTRGPRSTRSQPVQGHVFRKRPSSAGALRFTVGNAVWLHATSGPAESRLPTFSTCPGSRFFFLFRVPHKSHCGRRRRRYVRTRRKRKRNVPPTAIVTCTRNDSLCKRG